MTSQHSTAQPVVVTPVQVFMVPSNTKLDRNTMKHILRMGHSRVPVHEPGDRYGPALAA